MIFTPNKKTENQLNMVSELLTLVLAILFFVFRGTIPFLKYPFILLMGYLIFRVGMFHKHELLKIRFKFLRNYFLPFILFSLVILGIFSSSKLSLIVVKDVLNIAVLFVLFAFASVLIKTKEQLNRFINLFMYSVIFLSFFVSVYTLIDFLGIDILKIPFIWDSQTLDNNFMLIPGYLSILSIFYLSKQKQNGLKDYVLYFFVFLFFFLLLVVSGSRRGVLLVVLFMAAALVVKLMAFRGKSDNLKVYNKIINLFFIAFGIVPLFIIGIYFTPSTYKNSYLKLVGTQDAPMARQRITLIFYRLSVLSGTHTDYNSLYIKFWSSGFDSRDPDTGWGSGKYTKTNEIVGINSQMVPKEAIGMIVRNDLMRVIDSNAYNYSHFYNAILAPGQYFDASVYCYVSEDFNGDMVSIYVSGETSIDYNGFYDLNRKGTWQKLSTFAVSKGGNAIFGYGICKKDVSDISQVEGHVIFAYPEFEISTGKDFKSKIPSTWGHGKYTEIQPTDGKNIEILPKEAKGIRVDGKSMLNSHGESIGFKNRITLVEADEGKYLSFTVFCRVSPDFTGTDVGLELKGGYEQVQNIKYNLKRKGTWQKLILGAMCKDGGKSIFTSISAPSNSNIDSLAGYVEFVYPEIKLLDEFTFDPIIPEGGWASGIYNRVNPLTGQNVGIVPKGAVGALYDAEGAEILKKGNYVTNNLIPMVYVNAKKGEHYKVSAYCYVSPDFNGNLVRIVTSSEVVSRKILMRQYDKYYDLRIKGQWQYLELDFEVIGDGRFPVLMGIHKNDPKPYPTLKGYVIFAYPQSIEISGKKQNNNISFKSFNSEFYKDNIQIPFNTEYASINHTYFSLLKYLNQDGDNSGKVDKIRNLISVIVSEDTTYYPFKANIVVKTEGIDLGQDRLTRWIFAKDLFIQEYSVVEKLIGGGYDFYGWYGKVFLQDHMKSDYPHNPFLQILLYSGVIGLFLYIVLLLKVLQIYIKYFSGFWVMAAGFGVVFYFTFFSGGNPFDPPVMGFFMLLPFLIQLVHKNELEVELENI